MNNEEQQEFDQDGERIIKTIPLTPLQIEAFQKNKRLHKQIGSHIKLDFHGQQSFISKPQIILFKDFVVGKVHFLVISLTNGYSEFNSFKVLPLPQKIRNYFEVQYTPKGKMASGTTCDIRFKFIPQLNEDINSFFTIKALAGGQISYPIKCTSRKTIVKCSNPFLNFQKIINGQSKKIKLTIKNEESLPSAYTFLNCNCSELGKNSEQQLKIIKNLVFERKGQIQGKQEKSIFFEFHPQEIGFFQFKFLLTFKNSLHSPPIEIHLSAQCIQVPVRIQQKVYDIQICLLGHIYRQKLKFYNKSQTPMSFKMVQPPETKKYFQFNPVVGYIQKQSVLDIWIKFTAQKDIVLYLTKFMEEKNHYRIPFQMIVKEQLLPVDFIIEFRFTSDRLNIKPRQLNFGRIFQGVSSKIEVQFQNQSQLPQQVYLNIKKNVYIQNDQPILKLLPLQTLKTSIIYRSSKLNELKTFHEEDKIICKITTGQIAASQLELHYVAEVVRSDLNLSYNKVDFPALQAGQIMQASTIIRNNTNKDILYEIFIPDWQLCGFKVTPVVKTLGPKQQTQISIQYSSFFKTLTPDLLNKIALKNKAKPQIQQKKVQEVVVDKKDKKEAKKQTKLTKQQQEQLQLQQKRLEEEERLRKQKQQQQRLQIQKNFNAEEELTKIGGKVFNFEKTQHYKWLLPIYFKQKDYSDVSAEINYLEVTTTTIQEVLVINTKEVDFGQIAVGSRSVKEINIFNNGPKDFIKKKNLPIFCSFNVLNSMKQIAENSNFKAVIQFQPIQQQKFQERLQFYTDKYTVSCCLKGKGVRPQVKIEPDNGLVPLGGVILDEYTEKIIKIKNVCNFQINFVLNKIGQGIRNTNSGSAFSYIPSYGVLPAHGFVEVKVRFKPDRISQKYYEKMKVHVEQQKSINYFYISGSCYSRQAYISNFRPSQMPNNQIVRVKAEYAFDSLRIKDQNSVYSLGNKTIILQFTKGQQKTYQRKLIIGSCKLLDNKLEKPTNFEIILPKDDRFQCDNMKGAVSAGSETPITFTYKTEQMDPLFATIPGLSSIGQWKELKGQIKLSGGFIKGGAVDLISLELILRFYSNQL